MKPYLETVESVLQELKSTSEGLGTAERAHPEHGGTHGYGYGESGSHRSGSGTERRGYLPAGIRVKGRAGRVRSR